MVTVAQEAPAPRPPSPVSAAAESKAGSSAAEPASGDGGSRFLASVVTEAAEQDDTRKLLVPKKRKWPRNTWFKDPK